MKTMYVYILECVDNTYYTGVTNNLERRFIEHQEGIHKESYTYSRRPLKLGYSAIFNDPITAIAFEKKIKKWSHTKKKALIEGRLNDLIELAKKKRKNKT